MNIRDIFAVIIIIILSFKLFNEKYEEAYILQYKIGNNGEWKNGVCTTQHLAFEKDYINIFKEALTDDKNYKRYMHPRFGLIDHTDAGSTFFLHKDTALFRVIKGKCLYRE